jgi:hypothetical protein
MQWHRICSYIELCILWYIYYAHAMQYPSSYSRSYTKLNKYIYVHAQQLTWTLKSKHTIPSYVPSYTHNALAHTYAYMIAIKKTQNIKIGNSQYFICIFVYADRQAYVQADSEPYHRLKTYFCSGVKSSFQPELQMNYKHLVCAYIMFM